MKNKNKKNGTAAREVNETPMNGTSEQRVLGYRGHCATQEHFPTTSLVLPDLTALRGWVGMMSKIEVHADCTWTAEQLALTDDGHIFSYIADMDEDDPAGGKIKWDIKKPPYDLGLITSQASPEWLAKLQVLPAEPAKADGGDESGGTSVESDGESDQGGTPRAAAPNFRPVPKPDKKTAAQGGSLAKSAKGKAFGKKMEAVAASKKAKRA